MNDELRDPRELELRDYLAVLLRRKAIIVVTVLIVVALAIGAALLETPRYRATAEILIPQQTTQDLVTGSLQTTNAQSEAQRVQTEIEVMRSRSVRDAVRDALGYVPSVTIAAKGATNVVTISATDTDPERAAQEADTYADVAITSRRDADIAELENAVEVLAGQVEEVTAQIEEVDQQVEEIEAIVANTPEEDPNYADRVADRDRAVQERDAQKLALQARRTGFTDRISQLQLALNGARVDGGGEVVSDAAVPGSPFAPDPIRNAAVGLVVGLLLGAGIAFLRDYLDDRIRSKEDVDTVTGGLDVLGLVPRVEGWKDRTRPQLVSLTEPNSPAAESYRGLRTSLQFVGVDRKLTTIQITSSSQGEGKTTTVTNLAVALARAGNRVVLVDCDLRRPRLHQFFGLENRAGFTSALLGGHNVGEILQAVPDVSRLAVMTAGPIPPNPSELLATQRARNVLSSLTEHADYVLVDSPPLLPVADAVVVAGYVDATLLVTTVSSTTKRNLHRSLEMLRQVDAPLVGTVLNGLGAEAAYAYSYGGYTTTGATDTGRSFFSRRQRRDDLGDPPGSATPPTAAREWVQP